MHHRAAVGPPRGGVWDGQRNIDTPGPGGRARLYLFDGGPVGPLPADAPAIRRIPWEALAEIAPTYFVTGNHEWAFPDIRGFKRELEDAGVTVLSNEYVSLSRNGDHILLAGIDDPNGFADQKTPAELAGELRAAEPEAFWMLLAHRNNYFEKEYSFLGADLVISGHGHGGVIRLPFTDGLLSVERSFFPSYTAGFYEANGGKVFVSRGLGNSGRTFRLFNRPEVVILTLKKG